MLLLILRDRDIVAFLILEDHIIDPRHIVFRDLFKDLLIAGTVHTHQDHLADLLLDHVVILEAQRIAVHGELFLHPFLVHLALGIFELCLVIREQLVHSDELIDGGILRVKIQIEHPDGLAELEGLQPDLDKGLGDRYRVANDRRTAFKDGKGVFRKAS